MSDEGFKLQASIKDNDGDMVNFRADSANELEAALLTFPFGAYAQTKASLRGAGAVAQIAQPVVAQSPAGHQGQPASAPGWAQPAQAAAPAPQAAPAVQYHPEGLRCPVAGCGEAIVAKDVYSKAKSKTFKFWTCPNQRNRDDGHHSSFRD
jgi:hypothetical protein